MRMGKFLVLGLALAFFASCKTVNVTTDYDRSIDFSTYKTYDFHQKGIDKLDVNDLDKARIIRAIEANMQAKGFTRVSSEPDLYVNVLASHEERISIDNGYYGWYDSWGYPSRVYQYTSGNIVIDIIDDKKNVLIWQGVGRGLDVSNVNRKEEDIPNAIAEILYKFPPQQAKK